MAQMMVSLPDGLKEWAEARAVEAHLDGAGEYLAALLRRERAEADKLTRLQAAIDEGLASGISERDAFTYIKELRRGLRRDVDAAWTEPQG